MVAVLLKHIFAKGRESLGLIGFFREFAINFAGHFRDDLFVMLRIDVRVVQFADKQGRVQQVNFCVIFFKFCLQSILY